MTDPYGSRRCDHCIYFAPEAKGRGEREPTYGFCHRYAPRPADKQYHVYWPAVANDHWCGEYFIGRNA